MRKTTEQKSSREKNRKRRNWLAPLASAFVVAASVCCFGPLEILVSNRGEFAVKLGEVLPVLLLTCLALAGLLFLMLLVIPERHRGHVTIVLVAFATLLWIQAGFLRWNYGVFDGRAIAWDQFRWQGWLDLSIWAAILFVAIRFGRRLSQHALILAVALLLGRSVVLFAMASMAPKQSVTVGALPEKLCRISTTSNIFHFLMDAFQTDVFLELVEEEGLSKAFDGFVVFKENLSSGSQTIHSVPTVFSSLVYDGTETQSAFFRKAKQSSFHRLLFERGYAVNLLPWMEMDWSHCTSYFMSKGVFAEPQQTRVLRTASHLFDVGWFRQSPQFMKQWIYNKQNWRFSNLVGKPPSHASVSQKALMEEYTKRLKPYHSNPTYSFMHIMPPHPPFVTLADGSASEAVLPHTRENYKNEARYVLRLFVGFLEKLKKLDLYDSSIILLHGDHGAGFPRQGQQESEAEKRIQWVSPLLALKPASSSGAMRLSEAPTWLADIPTTMMDLVAIPHSYAGKSILELDSSEERTRHVVFVTDKGSGKPTVHPWVVTGDRDDPSAWHEQAAFTVQRQLKHYDWGTHLGFGMNGSGEEYLTSGWSTTASAYSWNDGTSSTITFAVDPPTTDIKFEIVVFPFISPGKVNHQRINITVNGRSRMETIFKKGDPIAINMAVPMHVLQKETLLVEFEFPDAKSPKELGIGPDTRKLAAMLHSFKTIPMTQATASGGGL